jgi:serine/threonine protein kinase
MLLLRSTDVELRDLTRSPQELSDKGIATGARIVRLLGTGGMSTVYMAEVDSARRASPLSPLCPGRIAVKFLKPSIIHELEQEGRSATLLAEREATALSRVMEHRPPTEFVVGFYGHGEAPVEIGGRSRKVPWLALEYIDGGPDGTILTDRIARISEGTDPIRALRLARGLVEGVAALHEEGIVHRDLKPDNVLIIGPVGDETPKIADCGIARVEGVSSTLAAFTREYAASEQWLSRPGERNPLIGPWTDVHALAAVVWFIITGEHWCRSYDDRAFTTHGARRSLRTAAKLHPGFAGERAALERLDGVLAHAASAALPEHVEMPEALQALIPGNAPPRFSTARAFASELLPILEDLVARWRPRAGREGRPITALRTTQLVRDDTVTIEPLAEFIEVPPLASFTATARPLPPLRPGSVAFQPDGKGLARFGGRLFFVWDKGAVPVPVPPSAAEAVAQTTHVLRAPIGGFVLVGPSHVRLVRLGKIAPVPLPSRASGGAVGAVQAAIGDGDMLAIVTAEVGEEGGPELWRLTGEATWSEPLVLSMQGRVVALSSGPYGVLAVGESESGTQARAIFIEEGGEGSPITRGVKDKPPLRVALCGAGRMAWGAGDGFVLAFDGGPAVLEGVEANDRPTAMGLDPVGIPWLVTTSTVLRRSLQGGVATWRAHYRKDDRAPALVGLGFTPDGVRVIDAQGGGVLTRPPDLPSWQSTSMLLGVSGA